MASVREIEQEIAGLPPDDLAELRAWFAEFDAASWDQEFEDDARSGRLDAVVERALEDYRRGRCHVARPRRTARRGRLQELW